MKICPILIVTLLSLGACTSASRNKQASPDAALTATKVPVGGDRPVEVLTPQGFDPKAGRSYPLLILLHGYGSSGSRQDSYLGLSEEALRRGYVFAAPDGMMSGSSRRFWNASEACCNFESTTLDDVAYLRKLIQDITAHYAIDPKRVFIFGHSNGAFMANRLACDASPIVTAVAGLAGTMRSDPANCKPERPVSVLAIHGTDDRIVSYRGGRFSKDGASYPGAEKSIAHWAKVNGCQPEAAVSAAFSILRLTLKAETTAIRYSGCRNEVRTELWKIEGGSHIPMFTADFVPKVLDFFEAK